jgi:hypothetical protein
VTRLAAQTRQHPSLAKTRIRRKTTKTATTVNNALPRVCQRRLLFYSHPTPTPVKARSMTACILPRSMPTDSD